MVLAFTLRSLTSTLLPQRTIGTCSQTRTRSPSKGLIVHLESSKLRRTVPVGNVLVGNSGCDVEHDDTALSVDVVPISETPELLLTCGIPDIELYRSVVLEYHK